MQDDWKVAQWQGYCTQAKDLADRKRRLKQVPIELVDEVKRHLVTVFNIKRSKQ